MKVIFMGSPDFAVPSLDIVHQHFELLAVVTAPDKIGGRGHGLIETAVKKRGLELNIPVLQPKNLKSEKFLSKLHKFDADIFVVVAFRMLPISVWNLPKLGTINVHGSLLPSYRGAAPIQRAIMNGETNTGVTTFRLKEEIDTGDIILQSSLNLEENDTCGKVYNNLKEMGANLLLDTLLQIQNGTVKYLAQDFSNNYPQAAKIFHEDTEIHFDKTCAQVHNLIRGLSPYPGAFFNKSGMNYKILLSQKTDIKVGEKTSGEWNFSHAGKFLIACHDFFIEVLEIQQEGRRKLSAKDFINGIRNAK